MKQILLNEIAEITSGQGAPQEEKFFSNTGYPFIRAGSLDLLLNGKKEDDLEKIDDKTAGEFKLRLFHKGTVVFAKSGMSSTLNRVYLLQNSCYIVNHLAAIVPIEEKIKPLFLMYWLRFFRPSRLIKDKAYPSIRLSDIQELKVPLFSPSVQSQIAYMLSYSETAIEKRREIRRLTDEFIKSAFLEMFGDPAKNLKNYSIIQIGKIVKETENEDPLKFPDKTYSYIDISGIDNVLKTVSTLKKIKGMEAPSRARQLVVGNDILISTVRPNLNAVAIVPQNISNPIASTGFCVLRVDKAKAYERYLFEICKSPFFVATLSQIANGASYPAVSDNDIKKMLIPLPSLVEQQKFADIVCAVEQLKTKQMKSEKELMDFFDSLMQEAFRSNISGDYQNG